MTTSPTQHTSLPSRYALRGTVITITGTDDQKIVAVDNGRISAVGGDELIDLLTEDGYTLLDVGERTILPGFIDPHVHGETSAAALFTMVDCRAPRCQSISDVLDTLRDNLHVAKQNGGLLIAQANLFYDLKLTDQRVPTRTELDTVSTTVPILIAAGGHKFILNSLALTLFGITAESAQQGVSGVGHVEVDGDGELTGIIAEVKLDRVVPDLDRHRDHLARGFHELFTVNGITSVGEISHTVAGLKLLDELAASGRLSQRVSAYLWVGGTMPLEDALDWQSTIAPKADLDRFRVRGLKIFADGGFSAGNAAIPFAYAAEHALTPDSHGELALNPAEIAEILSKADSAGLQLAVHANGERAQAAVLDAVELRRKDGESPFPVRIEHAGNLVTDIDAVTRWKELGIIPVTQPAFLYSMADFFPIYMGPKAASGRFPFRTLTQEHGIDLVASSDFVVGSEINQNNPLYSISWCVERKSFLGEIVDPDETVSVETALRAHTLNAAAALGVDAERGSLEVGKLADIIVLNRDPRRVPVEEIKNIVVDHVFLGGDLVHTRDGVPALQNASADV